jgi:hypothetical protein
MSCMTLMSCAFCVFAAQGMLRMSCKQCTSSSPVVRAHLAAVSCACLRPVYHISCLLPLKLCCGSLAHWLVRLSGCALCCRWLGAWLRGATHSAGLLHCSSELWVGARLCGAGRRTHQFQVVLSCLCLLQIVHDFEHRGVNNGKHHMSMAAVFAGPCLHRQPTCQTCSCMPFTLPTLLADFLIKTEDQLAIVYNDK